MTQTMWANVYLFTLVGLIIIVLLLFYRQLHRRDFYIVEHFTYDLTFFDTKGIYGKTNVRIERGSMMDGGCRSECFMDYAAAKASFDYQEELHSSDPMRGTESIHRVYVVNSFRKPRNARLVDDKYRSPLLHQTPHQTLYARRKEAREDRELAIANGGFFAERKD